MKTMHILWVGGGTAGHTAPLIAVLEATRALAEKKGIALRSSYVGMESDIRSPLISALDSSVERHTLTAGKIHRHLTWDQFRQFARILQSVSDARTLVGEIKPDLVFAKGGFVSVPVVRAARAYGIPVYTHESDAKSGLANRYISRTAEKIFTSYPVSVYQDMPQEKLQEVGQPVRQVFYDKHKVASRSSLPLILVVGGSQGARRINRLLYDSWSELLRFAQIVHITGPHEHAAYESLKDTLPDEQKKRLALAPFLAEEFPGVLQSATVVISRAGGTVSELAACRKASILIPLSTAAQNHQWANASALVGGNAAIALDELKVTSKELVDLVHRLVTSDSERQALEKAIARFDHPNAAQEMAIELLARMAVK